MSRIKQTVKFWMESFTAFVVRVIDPEYIAHKEGGKSQSGVIYVFKI